jgi:hypothetical protein
LPNEYPTKIIGDYPHRSREAVIPDLFRSVIPDLFRSVIPDLFRDPAPFLSLTGWTPGKSLSGARRRGRGDGIGHMFEGNNPQIIGHKTILRMLLTGIRKK